MKKKKDMGDEELGWHWASLGGVGALFMSVNLNKKGCARKNGSRGVIESGDYA